MKGRMALLDASATGEENVLEGKRNDEMNDLKYRRQQLMTLQEEVLDLEDMSGGISITDFAFDDFAWNCSATLTTIRAFWRSLLWDCAPSPVCRRR